MLKLRNLNPNADRLIDLEIELYDSLKVNKRIEELYRLFIRFQDVEVDLPLPRITSNYNIRYEQFLPSIKSSKIENYVFKKIYLESRKEKERTIFLTKFTLALRYLNKDELEIFNLAFYSRLSDQDIMLKTNMCEKLVRKIRKVSYIRMLSFLGLEDDCIID